MICEDLRTDGNVMSGCLMYRLSVGLVVWLLTPIESIVFNSTFSPAHVGCN